MATLFAQNPITLRNPFSLLESDFNLEDSSTTTIISAAATAATSKTADVDLDLSTWSVVNSPSASDDEDDSDDDNDDDEIYHWQTSKSDSESASSPDVQSLEPLHLSTGKDGFTNISKAKTARSINSLTASCPEHRGAWVLKVNKKRRNKSQEPQHHQSTGAATISTHTNDKRRLSLSSTDPSSSSSETKTNSTRVETENEDLDDALYMDMSEHELSKSSKASTIKNNRIAISYERELAKDLRCFSEETDKVDKKLLSKQHQFRFKSVGSRKSNNKAFIDEL
ncbi:hypothetical protein BGZ96_008554 [Linnemannia gamsii]|uniref:Uncharacterized protein n=1 Tax=Linnemannia gamsii TaxID=64522 RepID=A0ABQ7JYK4_9FUNG|nr:hypothetical protein BGZ96_008554 [Linnemannia gamsii]